MANFEQPEQITAEEIFRRAVEGVAYIYSGQQNDAPSWLTSTDPEQAQQQVLDLLNTMPTDIEPSRSAENQHKFALKSIADMLVLNLQLFLGTEEPDIVKEKRDGIFNMLYNDNFTADMPEEYAAFHIEGRTYTHLFHGVASATAQMRNPDIAGDFERYQGHVAKWARSYHPGSKISELHDHFSEHFTEELYEKVVNDMRQAKQQANDLGSQPDGQPDGKSADTKGIDITDTSPTQNPDKER